MKNILEVRNLNKSYKHFSLQDISFSLPEGCITGFHRCQRSRQDYHSENHSRPHAKGLRRNPLF